MSIPPSIDPVPGSKDEDVILQELLSTNNWETIRKNYLLLSNDSRTELVFKHVMSKVPWSVIDDQLLRQYVAKYGTNDWKTISEEFVCRSEDSCRKRWFDHLSLSVENVQTTTSTGVPLSMSVDHKDSVTNFEDCTPVLHNVLPNLIQDFAEREVNYYFSNMMETMSVDQDLRMVLKEIVKAEVNDCFSRLFNKDSAMASNDNFPMEEDFPDTSDLVMAGRPLSRDEICRLVQDEVRIKVNDYFVKMKETATFGQNFRMLLQEMVKAEFQGKYEDSPPVGDIPASSSGGDVFVPTEVSLLELSRIVKGKVRIIVNDYFSKVKDMALLGQEFRMVLKEIAETEVKDCCSRLQKKRKWDTSMEEIVETEGKDCSKRLQKD